MRDADFFRASQARTQRGLTVFDFALDTAIADRVLNSPGTLFYLDKESTGICTVEGNVDQGTTGNALLASPGFSLFNEQGFSGFRLSADAQPGKVLRIVIATGMSIKPGDAVTSGSVATQTVDAGLVRTLNNQAFLASGAQGGVVGQFSHSQLFNSGTKNIVLESMSLSSTTGQIIPVGRFSATFGGGLAGHSKFIGGATSVGVRQLATNAASLLTAQMLSYTVSASSVVVINFREPVVITPGNGFGAVATVVNTDLSVNYEYFE
jgi:hypothetical protein